MRIAAFCWIGLALVFTGCCGSCEQPAKTDTETKSSAAECEDCCSSASRSAILKKSVAAKQAAEDEETQTK